MTPLYIVMMFFGRLIVVVVCLELIGILAGPVVKLILSQLL